MKTLTLFITFFTIFYAKLQAQENRMYSQYMFNMLAVNPAYAGNQYQFTATALNRAQWTGIKGAPVTQTFSAHYRGTESRTGLGILFNHDQIGVHNNSQLFASYSYSIKSNRIQFSFGLQGGVEMLRADFNKLTLNDPLDAPLNGTRNEVKPNVGAGIFIDNGRGYVGVSVPTLLEYRSLNMTATALPERARYFILSAGKVFDLSREVEIKPSFIARYQRGNPLNAEISTTFIFNSRVFAGLSYRTSKSAVILAQIQLNENFRFGYAFDHAFNSLAPYGTGSHEVMLNYRIDLLPKACHTYY